MTVSALAAVAVCIGLSGAIRAADVEIACRDFTLRVGEDACVKSLVVKATGEECVDAALRLPLFTVTQDRPFNNEIKLIHPNKRTVYPACSLRRVGDTLVRIIANGYVHRTLREGQKVLCAGVVALLDHELHNGGSRRMARARDELSAYLSGRIGKPS
jgi:hypothetical protein